MFETVMKFGDGTNGGMVTCPGEDLFDLLWALYRIKYEGQAEKETFVHMLMAPREAALIDVLDASLLRMLGGGHNLIDLLLHGGSIYSMRDDIPFGFYADGANPRCIGKVRAEEDLADLEIFVACLRSVFPDSKGLYPMNAVIVRIKSVFNESRRAGECITFENREYR